MSDEEKKAIEYIKNILNYKKLYGHDGIETNFLRPIDKQKINIFLNLIKKQSKEIEELKKIDESNSKIMLNMSERHFHDREKIRAYEKLVERIVTKIEELKKEKEKYFEKQVIQHEIDMLQELLKRGE